MPSSMNSKRSLESTTTFLLYEHLNIMVLLKGKIGQGRYCLNILINAGILKKFWDEAVNTTYYVICQCLIKFIFEKTPYELLNKKSLS